MSSNKPFASYVVNNLYDNNFFTEDLPGLLADAGSAEESDKWFRVVKRIFADNPPLQLNESQLESGIIKPVLGVLGWFVLPQDTKVIQGKNIRPDWTLFASKKDKDKYLSIPPHQRRDVVEGIITFAEIKSADKELDTRKASRKDNPYLQLVEYLLLTRIPFGFLTNGVEWWLVDNEKISAEKRFLRVDLAQIIADDNADAFRCFYYLFHRTTFVPNKPEEKSVFITISQTDAERRNASEEDLRKVIYGADGTESLFEVTGRALFAAAGKKADPAVLRQVYENSLYFVFRLLFIAYFEDRHWGLLKKHSHYPDLSLRKLDEDLQLAAPDSFTGWNHLQTLFRTLNVGNLNLSIPLLNGGLFDDARAALLAKPKVMDNATLRKVLNALFVFGTTEIPLRRDFKALSVTHLGTIYESLLEFEFRITPEDLMYVVYKETKGKDKGKLSEGFFDVYDTGVLEKNKDILILNKRPFPKNTLYLVGSQNSRKASASFYTPASLSLPLVRRAIDHQIACLPKDKSILDLRILDNACGSGHLLIESLNYLTSRALDRMEDDALLATTLSDETQRISEAMDSLGLQEDMKPDEFMILKRILLKKVLYGVDIQVFAIELAHLSLWIETFVFGTPLSLIEHHVKVGNALIGTEIKTFQDAIGKEGRQLSMLNLTVKDHFEKLYTVYKKLNAIQDTTADDIAASKKLFKQEIGPALKEMNLLLDLCNYRDMLMAEGRDAEAGKVRVWEQAPALLKGQLPELQAAIDTYRAKYGFFNWEIEFPEAFADANGKRGFHIIVGNPPWDKTKFEDPMFFSQYRSNYRNLPNSKKKELQDDLLSKPDIRQRYESQRTHTLAVNEYYKLFYPLNKGAGDGNLFRFFVERNLRLLTLHGTLNYVLPTALLTEDGSATLRKAIFEDYSIVAFDGFENRQKIFPDVDIRYKFGLLQIERVRNPEQKARVRFMLTDPAVLESEKGIFEYGLDDIRATSPEFMAYMEVKNGRADLELLTRFYKQFAPLSSEWIDFRTELHATNDKKIFLESYQDGYLPLYKGASIWQYNSLFAESEYWLDEEQFDAYLQDKEISRLIEDVYPSLQSNSKITKEKTVLKALELHKRKELFQFIIPDRIYYRLGFRDIASDTNERTLICCLLPKNIGIQNTLYVSIPKYYIIEDTKKVIYTNETSIERMLFIQALFNSIPVDWILRFSVSIHVNKTYLMRQPMPQPTDAELAENPVYREMILNSLKLSLYYNPEGFFDLKMLYGLKDTDIPTTSKQVEMLKIRNDVLVAGIYGVTKPEMEHMLKGFNVLARKKPEYVKALLDAME